MSLGAAGGPGHPCGCTCPHVWTHWVQFHQHTPEAHEGLALPTWVPIPLWTLTSLSADVSSQEVMVSTAFLTCQEWLIACLWTRKQAAGFGVILKVEFKHGGRLSMYFFES